MNFICVFVLKQYISYWYKYLKTLVEIIVGWLRLLTKLFFTGFPVSKIQSPVPAPTPGPAKDYTWDDHHLFSSGKLSWLESLFRQSAHHLNGRDYNMDRIPLRVYLGKRSQPETFSPGTSSLWLWFFYGHFSSWRFQ